ncbi:MAG TPA: GNAT family N-acetyltransferase [Terriglobales bacterium]|nr:GNAT family N-acetyltransferase [Terriglobales bacterium]
MLRIRESGLPDFDRLWQIDQECFSSGIAYSREELAEYMGIPGSFTLAGEIAEAGGSAHIVGFVLATRDRRGNGHIITIDVLEEARRRGLGSQLLAAAERRLAEQGCKRILLEVAVDNAAAIAFYNRHQYAVLKTLPRYYLDTLDALLMDKKLAP